MRRAGSTTSVCIGGARRAAAPCGAHGGTPTSRGRGWRRSAGAGVDDRPRRVGSHPSPRPLRVVLARKEPGHRRGIDRRHVRRDREHLAVVEARGDDASRPAPDVTGKRSPRRRCRAARAGACSRCAASFCDRFGSVQSLDRAAQQRHAIAGQPLHRSRTPGRAACSRGPARDRPAARPSGAPRSAARRATAPTARPRTRRRPAPRARRTAICARLVPAPAQIIDADARQQRRHELHDHAEPRVRAEHRHDVVEQRGRPDEGERPDRPLRRQRAEQRGDGDDDEHRHARDATAADRRARRRAGHQRRDDEPERDDAPAEAHLLFEQPLAHARRMSRSRCAMAPSSGCATGGTR